MLVSPFGVACTNEIIRRFGGRGCWEGRWGFKLTPYCCNIHITWTRGWEVAFIPIFVGNRAVGIREMGTGAHIHIIK